MLRVLLLVATCGYVREKYESAGCCGEFAAHFWEVKG